MLGCCVYAGATLHVLQNHIFFLFFVAFFNSVLLHASGSCRCFFFIHQKQRRYRDAAKKKESKEQKKRIASPLRCLCTLVEMLQSAKQEKNSDPLYEGASDRRNKKRTTTSKRVE